MQFDSHDGFQTEPSHVSKITNKLYTNRRKGRICAETINKGKVR